MAYELLMRSRVCNPPHETGTPQLLYNFQHDLESLWWIALWVILVRIGQEASQLYARTIYISRLICTPERGGAFLADGYLAQDLERVLSPEASPFAQGLEKCRMELKKAYWYRELEGKEDDPNSYAKIYSEVGVNLLEYLKTAQNMPNPPSLIDAFSQPASGASSSEPKAGGSTSAATSSSRKRARSASETDGEQNEPPPLKVARLDDC